MIRLPTLDPLLHQPARTQIAAYLSSRGEATFAELKRVLGVTDGNLGAHLNKLIEAGYIRSREEAGRGGGRTQTVLLLTHRGRKALVEYVAHLSALMSMEVGDEPTPNPLASARHTR
jgi:predicted ArsR family transcriptional regulator